MMTYSKISIDIETYSETDLSKSGAYAYASDPSFQILLIAYKLNDEPEKVIDLTTENGDGFLNGNYIKTVHSVFYNLLTNKNVIKTAFNANFERTCLSAFLGVPMPPEQWRCTMIKAAEQGLPMSLAGVGEALGLPDDKAKLTTGKALIRYFCQPCKPTRANGYRTRNLPCHDPEKWRLFREYCSRDVTAERAIDDRLPDIADSEQVLWELDQRMNDYGVKIDAPYIDKIIAYDAAERDRLMSEACRLTGLENPNSLTQLKEWLSLQGLDMESVTKETVKDVLRMNGLPLNVKRVLEIRALLGKTSVKKYEAMKNAVCGDDRLRGALQFYGANRTGRWAGRIVQTHNLPQNHIEPLDLCRKLVSEGDFNTVEMLWGDTAPIFSELIRTAFIAGEGKTFYVSDFSAIEARVIAWIADEKWRNEAFKKGADIYCESASKMFGVPVVKNGVNGHLRARGKVAELACGYGGGVGAMLNMDTTHTIPEEDLKEIVEQWRAASPKIVNLWYACENAAFDAINDPKTIYAAGDKLSYLFENGNLYCMLPSGRKICYFGAGITSSKKFGKKTREIRYLAVNQETKKWSSVTTYGGKLAENAVQAIARDLLAAAMLKVSERYKIVMHVHDEMIIEVCKSELDACKTWTDKAMRTAPEWADGLCVKGEGYETEFYRKD